MRRSAPERTAPTGAADDAGCGRFARSTSRLYSASGSVTVRAGCCAHAGAVIAKRTVTTLIDLHPVMSCLRGLLRRSSLEVEASEGGSVVRPLDEHVHGRNVGFGGQLRCEEY